VASPPESLSDAAVSHANNLPILEQMNGVIEIVRDNAESDEVVVFEVGFFKKRLKLIFSTVSMKW